MAGDDSGSRLLARVFVMSALDGVRPAGMLGWASPVAPVVTQAAVGAGHWASGRRRRAMAAWASAAGFALVAWGLGTEAPTRAESKMNIERHKDLLRERGVEVPATATGTQSWMTSEPGQDVVSAVAACAQVAFGVRSGLRRPRRLTVLAVANEAPLAVFFVVRAARAVQRRRPRIAAGSALVAVGSVARLRAAAAEPLR
jgi:sugar phosphate isomerase/epimerase